MDSSEKSEMKGADDSGKEAETKVVENSLPIESTDQSPEAEKTHAGLDFGIPEGLQRRIPPFLLPYVMKSMAEDLVDDTDTLGPDAFPVQWAWTNRGLFLPGQPTESNDVRIIDIDREGTRSDRGMSSWKREELEPILRGTLPKGSGSCRVILGTPESGRLTREFVVDAVNLCEERARYRGDSLSEDSFQDRTCPGFDLARLRAMWKMAAIQWQPFSLTTYAMRRPVPNSGFAPTPDAGVFRARTQDILYFQPSWLMVQTLPLENDRFVFICALPSRKFTAKPPTLESAPSFSSLKNGEGDSPKLSQTQIFELLHRDVERSCRECFEDLLLSGSSATVHSTGDSELLCQLLLLDVFRAISESLTRLTRDIVLRLKSMDIPQFNTLDVETQLMESKCNWDLFEKIYTDTVEIQTASNHLLELVEIKLKLLNDSGHEAAAAPLWFRQLRLELKSDLEHSLSVFTRLKDLWTAQWNNSSDLAQKAESKNVARLTLVAAIFLPLSFGADLLGMQFRVSELHMILYDYLGLVVSAGLVFFICYRTLPAMRLLRKTFKGRRVDGSKKQTPLRVAWMNMKAQYSVLLILIWSIFTASFIRGMVGSIPAALEILKYGAIAWGSLFGIWVIGCLLMGWVSSAIWKSLGWHILD